MKKWIVIIGVALLIFFFASGKSERMPDVNEELARTARTAVEMAQTAQEHNDAAYLSPGQYRLLALAIGISVPLVAVAIFTALATRRGSDELDLLEVKERLELPDGNLLSSQNSLPGPGEVVGSLPVSDDVDAYAHGAQGVPAGNELTKPTKALLRLRLWANRCRGWCQMVIRGRRKELTELTKVSLNPTSHLREPGERDAGS